MTWYIHPRQLLVLAIALIPLLAVGCANKNNATITQKVALASGDFGALDYARVVNVDPINLKTDTLRLGVSFGEVAVSILAADETNARYIHQEVVRVLGHAIGEELEDYIRSQYCVYTVKARSQLMTSTVVETAIGSAYEDDVGSDLQDAIDKPEYENLSPKERIKRITELADEIRQGRAKEFAEKNPNDLPNLISVISQCLLGVSAGSDVRIVKTAEKILILPNSRRYSSIPEEG